MEEKTFASMKTLIISILLITATLAVYWQVQHHQFVRFDDEVYVTSNSHVRSGLNPDSILWAFTNTDAGFWHPLTWMSHILDYELYRMNAGGHLWTSVLLHAGSTVLLFLFLTGATRAPWRSAFVAALFALHPLHVESVAWVAERKDVLSTFFWFLTLVVYLFYVKRPGWSRYGLVLAIFVLGLMAKPMLVSLPFVMLLLDCWPLKRLGPASDIKDGTGRLILEKIPFLIISIVMIVITFFAAKNIGAIPSLEHFPLDMRLSNALVSYAAYIGKMLWPTHLSIFYPYPGSIPSWQSIGSGLLLIVMCMMIMKASRLRPYLGVGWLWYLGTLIPVIGIIQIGYHAMADRYTYIPLTGLFIMISWGVVDLSRRFRIRKSLSACLAVGTVICFATVTWFHLQHWRDGAALFSHALEVTKNNALAHNNMSVALVEKGDLEGAKAHLKIVLALEPRNVDALENMGVVLARQNDLEGAAASLRKAIQLQPKRATSYNYLGAVLNRQNKLDQAVSVLQKAIQYKQDYASAVSNLGNVFLRKGDVDQAIQEYTKVLALRKDDWESHNNIGAAFMMKGDYPSAIAHFQASIAINPHSNPAQQNLRILINAGKDKETIK